MHQARCVAAAVITVVGTVSTVYGTMLDHTATYRAGLALLLLAATLYLDLRQEWRHRRDVALVMRHQTAVARLAMGERQRYTELGWRAAKLDSQVAEAEGEPMGMDGDGQVVRLPVARHVPTMRKNGSA
jgi:hypothetical protein